MARRKNTIDAGTIRLLVAVGLLWAGGTVIVNALESPAGWAFVAFASGAIVLIIALNRAAKRKRLAYLMDKYGDETIVTNIYHHKFWYGQSAEQLLDSLGEPHARDDKLLKTRKREVWKYNRTGANRYGLRITLDNDIVTAWDHKK